MSGVSAALLELFGTKTQVAIAAELSARGMAVDQTKVSAWKRGRQPSLDQIAEIEAWAGVPRGWVLIRAGYVGDVTALGTVPDAPAPVEDRLASIEESLEQVLAMIEQLGLALASHVTTPAGSPPAKPRTRPARRGT